MTIISISRGSYRRGKVVAEKVALQLGYRCLSREVILNASKRFNIPELKLRKAIHDAPSILERFGHDKRSYITYYQSVLARSVQKDNIVYHGMAGHLLLPEVAHLLKVRINADMDERVAGEMKRHGTPRKEAKALIIKDDQERRKWTQSLYGVDPWDSNLYDLVLGVRRFTHTNAVDFICRAARLSQFQTTKISQQKIDDLVISTQIKAALIDAFPNIAVKSDYGNVMIYAKSDTRVIRKLQEAAQNYKDEIEGIKSLEIHPGKVIPPGAV